MMTKSCRTTAGVCQLGQVHARYSAPGHDMFFYSSEGKMIRMTDKLCSTLILLPLYCIISHRQTAVWTKGKKRDMWLQMISFHNFPWRSMMDHMLWQWRQTANEEAGGFEVNHILPRQDRKCNHKLTRVRITVNNTSHGMLMATICFPWLMFNCKKISEQRIKGSKL